MTRLFALIAILLNFTAMPSAAKNIQNAVFAGGCFWCIESDFESVKGVTKVVSGYTGGSTKNPTYKKIADHYEAVKITYDADVVGYDRLVDLFFRSVDATDAGGQFCDRGDNYRTAIFAQDAGQQKIATAGKASVDASGILPKPVVTPILGKTEFYRAEGYHQNYYKGKKRVVTRFGLVKQSDAYKRYRRACGRDKRVQELWGDQAAFANTH